MLKQPNPCSKNVGVRSYLLTVAFAVAANGAPAAIYKWVDDKGVTQYSENPPPGKKPVQMPIQTAPAGQPSGGAQGTTGAKSWQQQEAEFQRRRVEREERRKKEEALGQMTAAERSRNCSRARQTLYGLDQQRPMYRINEKGERVYLEDKDREQMRERMQQIAEQNCDR